MKSFFCLFLLLFLTLNSFSIESYIVVKPTPLPEHPRPDFKRKNWINLNGYWQFEFDGDNTGLQNQWFASKSSFSKKILVPFPWGAPLSEVNDEADIGWYKRKITVPEKWNGNRIFLVIGASDWHTTAWLDGNALGEYKGGYTPFEFELTPYIKPGQSQNLVIRVEDTKHPFKLYGKQGYGDARGIWQTVYLEARPLISIREIYFTPDIDNEKVNVKVVFSDVSSSQMKFEVHFNTGDVRDLEKNIPSATQEIEFEIGIPAPHLWCLDDPFLYEVDAILSNQSGQDRVSSYFGMRKISVMNLPGTDYPYIALNNKPVYLQTALDQAYHPDGFYTYPSDAFMRDEILRTRRIGLNGQRIHVKIDHPRKLYWADKLGVLIMADIPNSWGEPDSAMRRETETALRGMIKRDYNHPAIFSWVLFNETWGLFSKDGNDKRIYKKETQDWVETMYHLAKNLDSTRLVEDNSPCNNDHVITDINSWHAYLPGYAWSEHLEKISEQTFSGSNWNFVDGKQQGNQPNFNSECGNVWGYKRSTGDVDWSWDYHLMMNAFRRHPKICGWLYTEHHDVINEWNGYYRYDRSEKITGLSGVVPGMTLNDLHSPFYISPCDKMCQNAAPGEIIMLPIYASFLTSQSVAHYLKLQVELHGWDVLGNHHSFSQFSQFIPFRAWFSGEIEPLEIQMPDQPALVIVSLTLKTPAGHVLHRNFTTFNVTNGLLPRDETITLNNSQARVIRIPADDFSDAQWTLKQWNIFNGLKVNGAGAGYFEYRIPFPQNLNVLQIQEAVFRIEASTKQFLGKDKTDAKMNGDYMRGKGTHDPGRNPNAYPMTDETTFPGTVRIRFNGESIGQFDLPDDPADHRGILSWHEQKQDRTLHEAGSYGYLISAIIPAEVLQKAARARELILRLEVDDACPTGLAIYGHRFGRYPIDPTIIFVLK